MENKTILMTFFSVMVLISFFNQSLAIAADLEEMLINEFDVVLRNWPSPGDYNLNVIRGQSRKHLKYLLNCGVKMGPGGTECSIEYRDAISRNKSTSKDCCLMIVKTGKQCHTEWMKLFFQFYQVKRFSSKVMIKTNEIWNKCSNETETISPFSG
ncbi:Prolamin-like domain [Arabidopsis thaliana x Arabidopsis arenosa]|uniref:Prolamin-like domain n=1 Tax=Arabidopsis thaliana x Arabidopsis arenosa TaxID=1240361 RepID=A0A8T2A3I2_9BRAS|nr:Prolamin-like domain [Arabidopsis thaliana x Arabidopsis arenosa]